MPERLSFEQAAAFPLVYQTAWRMVVTRGDVRPGQTVLIHGAGGGAGGAALEIARLAGARVFATTSGEEKAKLLAEAGAEVVIDYTKQDVAKEIRSLTGKRGVDVVIDSVGDKTWMTSLKSAAKGGRIVTCGATTGPEPEGRAASGLLEPSLDPRHHDGERPRVPRDALGGSRGQAHARASTAPSRSPAPSRPTSASKRGDHHGKIVLVPDAATREWPDGD